MTKIRNFDILGAVFPHFCPDERESWHPCQISRLSEQKCGNTASKTIKITNFGHKFASQGSLVCTIVTQFSDFVRVSRWILSV